MVEISLEEFEDFYKEKLNQLFFKVKRIVKKVIDEINGDLVGIKLCMDHFLEISEKIDQKSLRSLNLFSERIKSYVDEIKVPESDNEINYTNLNDLLNSIKKLFTSINEIARKSLPKFQKEVQPEIKELDFKTRRLRKKQMILDKLLRKKYTDVKNAEALLERLPKIFNLKENIEKSKSDLDTFEKDLKEREEKLKQLNSELVNLEKDELFKNLEERKEELFKLRISINDKLGFKKALKKFKFEIEKGNLHVPNIDLNYLRDFLKNPIEILSNEGQNLQNFTSTLVQLRRILEENKLNLKSDIKDKTIEQINDIFNKKEINKDLDLLKSKNENIKEIEKKISEAGLAKKLEELKNEISVNTIKFEHIQTDCDRRNKDYNKYLNALKEEREAYQNLISEVTQEPVKINISFSF